jgi:hypothetical protein
VETGTGSRLAFFLLAFAAGFLEGFAAGFAAGFFAAAFGALAAGFAGADFLTALDFFFAMAMLYQNAG